MRVIEPKELTSRRQERLKRSRKNLRRVLVVLLFVLAIGIYSLSAWLIPLPTPTITTITPNFKTDTKPILKWPNYGQAAIGTPDYGVLAQNGKMTPKPIASIAKVVTALAILKAFPLSAGENGPTITISHDDVLDYQSAYSQGQSVIPVVAGEKLTEYQALEAMLLPSANNIAELLANWAFGSTTAYLDYANNLVKSLGVNNTHIADASGFSPKTVSTAKDLVYLAKAVTGNVVLTKIVALKQTYLPVVGVVSNVNFLLGKHGVTGIKTGNTDQAGGCYLFSATRQINDEQAVTVIGAVIGAPNLASALQSSQNLIDTSLTNFKLKTIIHAGQSFGEIKSLGTPSVQFVASQDLTLPIWPGTVTKVAILPNELKMPIKKGDVVGRAEIAIGNQFHNINVLADGDLPNPSLLWRLRHLPEYF